MTPEQLYKENEGLMYYTAKKWLKNKTADQADNIIGEARIYFWIACKQFDETRGIKFSTFAVRILNNNLQKYVYRRVLREPNTISLETPVQNFKDGGSTSLFETIECEQDFEENTVYEILSRYKHLELSVLHEMSQEKIGEMFGISQVHAGRLVRKEKSEFIEELKNAC